MTKLDYDKAYALIGEFMWAWAIMEKSLDDAVARALKLDGLQSTVLRNNIRFRDKIHILRTLINLFIIDKAQRDVFDKRLDKLAKFSADRNMLAHTVFRPHDSKPAVNFLIAKAKGKLVFPDISWDEAKFKRKFIRIGRFNNSLEKITEAFEEAGDDDD